MTVIDTEGFAGGQHALNLVTVPYYTLPFWWRSLALTLQRSTGRIAGILMAIWISRYLASPRFFFWPSESGPAFPVFFSFYPHLSMTQKTKQNGLNPSWQPTTTNGNGKVFSPSRRQGGKGYLYTGLRVSCFFRRRSCLGTYGTIYLRCLFEQGISHGFCD